MIAICTPPPLGNGGTSGPLGNIMTCKMNSSTISRMAETTGKMSSISLLCDLHIDKWDGRYIANVLLSEEGTWEALWSVIMLLVHCIEQWLLSLKAICTSPLRNGGICAPSGNIRSCKMNSSTKCRKAETAWKMPSIFLLVDPHSDKWDRTILLMHCCLREAPG